MANKRKRPTNILDAAKEVAEALQHLSDLFAERRMPRTQAGKMVQFDTREGWVVSPSMAYTLSQTEVRREMPADHAG